LTAPIKRHLQDERATLGLVRAASDVVCPACHDTGYLNLYPVNGWFGLLAWQLEGTPVDKIFWCDCEKGRRSKAAHSRGYQEHRAARLDDAFDNAGIPPRFEGLGFDTLPQQHLIGKELALAMARMFADWGYTDPRRVADYDPDLTLTGHRKPGLCLIGPPGVGKTGILSVAFRRRIEQGDAGLWIELYQFFEEIQSQYGSGDAADQRLSAAQKAPLLFLDDCGDPDRRESSGQVRAETDDKRRLLWTVLDYRHGAGLPTLITSNLSRSDFERQWGTRLAARVWEMCCVVPVGGADLRETIGEGER